MSKRKAQAAAQRAGLGIQSNGRDDFAFEVEASYPETGRRIREDADDPQGLSSIICRAEKAADAWAYLAERIASLPDLPPLYEARVWQVEAAPQYDRKHESQHPKAGDQLRMVNGVMHTITHIRGPWAHYSRTNAVGRCSLALVGAGQ